MPSTTRSALFAAVLCLGAPAAVDRRRAPVRRSLRRRGRGEVPARRRKGRLSPLQPEARGGLQGKGDWCAEHERPESQCVLCHPELAKKGIK